MSRTRGEVFSGSQCAVLTAGPARMADHLAIDLPYPCRLDVETTDRFGDHTRRIYQLPGME